MDWEAEVHEMMQEGMEEEEEIMKEKEKENESEYYGHNMNIRVGTLDVD